MRVGKFCTCNDCKYADKEEMKCRPNSKDCRSEYDLEELDFVKFRCCDFYKQKERQISKKVRYDEYGREEGYPHCPTCGKTLINDFVGATYCIDCGQKLDWEDEE